MKITADIRATANGAVDTYSDLSPLLKRAVATAVPGSVELAYQIQSGGTPHFTGNDARLLEEFFTGVNNIQAAFKRHFGRGISSRHLVAMAMPNWSK